MDRPTVLGLKIYGRLTDLYLQSRALLEFHLHTSRDLRCFHFLAIVSKVVSICVQVLCWHNFWNSWVKITRSTIAGLYVLLYKELLNCLPKQLCRSAFSQAGTEWEFLLFQTLISIWQCHVLDLAILIIGVCNSSLFLICISLITVMLRIFWNAYLPSVDLFGEMSVQIFCLFFNWVDFLAVEFQAFLKI